MTKLKALFGPFAPGGASACSNREGKAMCSLSRLLVGLVVAAAVCGGPEAAPFAYITNELSGSVSVIDTATNGVVATVPVGAAPIGVAVNPSGTRVYVGLGGANSVAVVDASTNTVVASIPVTGNPTGIAINPSGTRVYATTLFSNNVSVIDTATNTVVATIPVGTTPFGIVVHPNGSRAYVAIVGTQTNLGSTVQVIDTAANNVIASVTVGLAPQVVAVNPSGTLVYATTAVPAGLDVIDTATNRVVRSIPLSGSPGGVAFNPGGTRIYVALFETDSVAVIDAATSAVIATIPVGTSPIGIAVTPSGARVYVANGDSDDVSVIDTVTNTVIATIPVGMVPVAFGSFIGPDVVVPQVRNYQGLWWNSPAGSESGWGINFAHQGDVIFATWFTYGPDNQPQWFTILAQKTATNVYAGPVSSFTGLPFNTVPYTANANVKTPSGTATFTFAADDRSAIFAYTVNGITQTKQIVPQQFGPGVPLPTCAWGAQPDLTLATNFQDLWWVTNGDESGWGINFTHQGNIIFATWFTYDANGKAWWLFSAAAETAVPKVYSGLIRTAMGPPFNAEPFDPNAVVRNTVGNATITVIDGNHATFDYTVNGVTQTKHLTRQVFAPTGTVCQ
jgi:YVTN family beta-propeller protein